MLCVGVIDNAEPNTAQNVSLYLHIPSPEPRGCILEEEPPVFDVSPTDSLLHGVSSFEGAGVKNIKSVAEAL